MASAFGGFNVTTPLASRPHNPINDLASNYIRDYFGSTCQTVFDCLHSRGRSTLTQLVSAIRTQCKRDINPERLRLVDNLVPLSKGRGPVKINMARGSEEHGFIVDASSIRAALIVLLQQSMIKALPPPKEQTEDDNTHLHVHFTESTSHSKNVKFRYAVDMERALLLPRYPRYIEYAKKNYQEEGAAIIEELLVHGRMLTEEVVVDSTECLTRYLAMDQDGGDGDGDDDGGNGGGEENEVSSEQKMALAQKVIDSLLKMKDDGFVEIVEPIDQKTKPTEENELILDDANVQIHEHEPSSSGRKRSLNEMTNDETTDVNVNVNVNTNGIGSILSMNKYKRSFPPGAVWRVNIQMFHASLRAFYVGRLVSERYGNEKSYGAIVSAALKYLAYRDYSPISRALNPSDLIEAVFTPEDIMTFLPPPILAELKNKAGGAVSNLSAALISLSQFTYPQVIAEVEEARGHAQGGKFEITTRQVMSYLKGRILHEVIKEHYGDVAARMCSILQAKGHLESDTIAESAMVPAKDARELLHRLYKSNYISLFYLQQAKQHNPANAMYLWFVDNDKIKKTVLLNTFKALYNLRLRRQHEVEVGKDWIERAKEAGETDENDSELDKLNYNKFCQGLERLDNACLQLDETLMLLKDFDN